MMVTAQGDNAGGIKHGSSEEKKERRRKKEEGRGGEVEEE